MGPKQQEICHADLNINLCKINVFWMKEKNNQQNKTQKWKQVRAAGELFEQLIGSRWVAARSVLGVSQQTDENLDT